jgi:mono/diheme cytochrome c family protein
MLFTTPWLLLVVALALLARADEPARANGAVLADGPLKYNDDIRPILVDACFACHGPDSASREADLRLDQRQAAIAMEAITPGKPEESEMVRRILSTDPDEQMPPPEIGKELTQEQTKKLVRWVREGATYQKHWSFLPPRRPELPVVAQADWVRNPIDRFVLARLETARLSPAPEADRRTLARRVSLDLTGLPPTPEVVARFVSDSSADAYEKLVDHLLASTSWGEHRGRYWLDYARYADTHGIHFDNYREMWTYRDWVIGALNQNMPFDQFTIENLAGDLLPNATLAQRVGSGFNRCNMTTNEGGIIDEEYIVLYARDRTETTSQVWLGLTAGCAVCHDHKFDPLSQREFYELSAFFNNTTQQARDGNIKDTPPIIVLPRKEDLAQWQELPTEIDQAQQQLAARRGAARTEFESWLKGLSGPAAEVLVDAVSRDHLHFQAALDEGQGKKIQVVVERQPRTVTLADSASWQTDRSALQTQGAVCELADVGDFARDQAFSCAAWIRLPANDGQGAICARMDNASAHRGWDFWLQRRQIGMHLVSAWPQNGLKVVGKKQVPANQWVHVVASYDGSGKATGVKIYYNGKPQETQVENDKLSGSIQTEVPFKIGQRNTSEPLSAASLQDLRIYDRVLAPAEVASLARLNHFQDLVAKGAQRRTAEETDELFQFWLDTLDEPFRTSSRRLTQLQQRQATLKARAPIAYVMQEKKEPATAYVLFRGEYDQRRDQVMPATPQSLPPFPAEFPRNRLGFARWLLLPEHPLTARVTVNRFWQEIFGTGIVKTAGDFGVSGQLPTHPELLDWLAVQFRTSGWDVKQLFKLLVTSATYRQSARTTPEKLEQDPEKRLLAHGPRFRMDAEMVRDYALAVSGLLVPKLGGPSVKPYQPPGVWEAIAMNVSNTRSYQQGSGDDLYRRSLYTFIKRMAPPASMDIFNAPNRELCTVTRTRTDTPMQALVTLNDTQFIEAARQLAQLVLQGGGTTLESRLGLLGSRLLAREFLPAETEVIETSLSDLHAYYQQHPEDAQKLLQVGQSEPDATLDPPTLATWTMLTNELMNLDEVLNK